MKPLAPLMLLLLGAITLRAADYFVATNGSNNANGAVSQPFRTIQKGINAATRPGDTVTVQPGTYSEELSMRSDGTPRLSTCSA